MTDHEDKALTGLLNEIARADLAIDLPQDMHRRAMERWDRGAGSRAVRRGRRPARSWLIAGGTALAAAALVIVGVNPSSRGRNAVEMSGGPPEISAEAMPAERPPLSPTLLSAAMRAPIGTGRAEPKKRTHPAVREREPVSYVPLSHLSQQDMSGSFQLARVVVSREMLADLGIVEDANRVGAPIQVDVVFGEDGLARAIRLAPRDDRRSQ
jgi:hypothetical protein